MMGLQLLALLAAALCGGAAPSSVVVDLTSLSAWDLDNSLGFGNVTLKNVTASPTHHLAALDVLQREGLIEDPLYRFNELNYRWAALDNFTYTAFFDASDSLVLAHSHQQLAIKTLDTAACVSLNGALLGCTANAHREHAFNVTGLLVPGGNKLAVTILSAAQYASLQAGAYPYAVPSISVLGGLPHFNFIRKAASDFGWDWGPAFAPSALGGVQLRGFSSPVLTGLHVTQAHAANGSVTLTINAQFQTEATGLLGGTLSVQVAENSSSTPLWGVESVSLSAAWCSRADDTAGKPTGLVTCSVEVPVKPPFKLWWPYELGPQDMYDVRVTHALDPRWAGADKGSSALSRRVQSIACHLKPARPLSFWWVARRRIGLRTVELVQDPIVTTQGAEVGKTFYFMVNGRRIWAKGANVVPTDILEARVTPACLRRLVTSARAAHMNMLRVWGGGRYMGDAFYDACDELGLLVWQEAMFACAVYPRDEAFLQEVRSEVLHQARRIGSHPSVAVWGGNNEVENAFEWFREVQANVPLYAVDYNTLFVETVGEALLEADPGTTWLDTSPSNGLISSQPYVKAWGNVRDASRGDVHFYDYSGNAFDRATYPKAKFVSEFGFMSWPSFPGYGKVTEPQDWVVDGEMSTFRMRHPNGIRELTAQLDRHFKREATAAGVVLSSTHFQSFIYLTQLHQALAYNTAVRQWRRWKSDPQALTGGALYWQLNDIWPGPSWSSLNYDGSWKLLHRAAEQFFAPVMVSAYVEGETLHVHLTNDLSVDVEGTLSIEAIPFAARQPEDIRLLLNASSLAIEAGASEAVVNISIAEQPLAPKYQTVHAASSAFFLRLRFCPSSASQAGNDASPTTSSESLDKLSAALHGEASPAEERPRSAWSPEGLLQCSEHLQFLSEFNLAPLEPPEISIVSSPEETEPLGGPADDRTAQQVEFQLESTRVALFVRLEAHLPGRFSQNGFIMLPWERQAVTWFPDDTMEGPYPESRVSGGSVVRLQALNMSVMSLQDAMSAYSNELAATVQDSHTDGFVLAWHPALLPYIGLLLLFKLIALYV